MIQAVNGYAYRAPNGNGASLLAPAPGAVVQTPFGPVTIPGDQASFGNPFAARPGSVPTTPAPVSTPARPADADFKPTFRTVKGHNAMTGQDYGLNEIYFASQSTANWMAERFGAKVVSQPADGQGGPFSVPEPYLMLEFPNGKRVNAGILASLYRNNPPDQFPGLAEKFVLDNLQVELGYRPTVKPLAASPAAAPGARSPWQIQFPHLFGNQSYVGAPAAAPSANAPETAWSSITRWFSQLTGNAGGAPGKTTF